MAPAPADRFPTLITLDVEDHGPSDAPPRFRDALVPLLNELQWRDLHATFFVVGSLAEAWRDDLRMLIEQGHEVGLHGYTHRFLRDVGPAEFRDELHRGRDTIAEIAGQPPVGFRAPYFSLTRDTPWAPDALLEAGFSYSSSVLPAWNPQAGFPGAPKEPFRWPNGLIELPVPVLGVGRFGVPLMGGAYLRLVPWLMVAAAERASRGAPRWTYAHPYDFDVDEAFSVRDGQSWVVAKLLFARRCQMLPRIVKLAGSTSVAMAALCGDPAFVADLPTWAR